MSLNVKSTHILRQLLGVEILIVFKITLLFGRICCIHVGSLFSQLWNITKCILICSIAWRRLSELLVYLRWWRIMVLLMFTTWIVIIAVVHVILLLWMLLIFRQVTILGVDTIRVSHCWGEKMKHILRFHFKITILISPHSPSRLSISNFGCNFSMAWNIFIESTRLSKFK